MIVEKHIYAELDIFHFVINKPTLVDGCNVLKWIRNFQLIRAVKQLPS
ncbi:hypothetical protein XIS1_370010 [Xenorhabdus innexi]|uniref:Uncharacterized protein n=1 Tax=Xenorhabdus innexi TaxID=290109 RepID=A0A1N6MXH0_9GAMM|nr:hypothetical protein XIS1_370010 [Xenorhabdus innexi]